VIFFTSNMEIVIERYENRIGPKSNCRVSRKQFSRQAGKTIKAKPSYKNTRVTTTRVINQSRSEKKKQQSYDDWELCGEDWESWVYSFANYFYSSYFDDEFW